MIFDRLRTVIAAFGHPDVPGNGARATGAARRWQKAFRQEPDLARDLMEMGGVMSRGEVLLSGGMPEPAPTDPYQLAREQGRRDLALELLALGHLSVEEFNQLMEKAYD